MEFRQLKTFVTAARLESFSKTAELLGYSQSAVTVQIRLLEDQTVRPSWPKDRTDRPGTAFS